MTQHIAILPGDGIGTEIVAEAVKVLNALDLKFEMETAPVGGAAYEAAGHPLPEEADAAKACVGYLPEQPPLYPEMTVQEYLTFAAELKGVKKAERKEQVCRAARRTGLEAVLPRLIRSLSKGYKQRVGIAQALLGSPRLIILDEPTVGLDPAQVIEIRKLIRELGRAHTVILSSHILSEVQAVCQQILILSKGHLAAAGSLEELTADGKSLEEVFLELTDGEPEEATGEEEAE